jgi:hypothetical protein
MDSLRAVFKYCLAACTSGALIFCLQGCDDKPISADQIAGEYSLTSDGRSLLLLNANGSYRHIFRVPDHSDMVAEGSWEEIPAGSSYQISLAGFYAFPSEGLEARLTRPSYYCIGIGRSWGRVCLNLGSPDAPKRIFKKD